MSGRTTLQPVLRVGDVPGIIELEGVPCPMGCTGPSREVARGGDRLHGIPGVFPVVQCEGCGLMRTDPRPTMDTVAAYYPEVYAPYDAGAAEVPATRRDRLLMALRLDGTRQLVPPVRPGRALEVGCASGRFMRKLRRRGWLVHGIEPSSSAASQARAKGFSVHQGPLETAPEPSEPYNLILASHTFEHLHDPVGSLDRLRSWAKPAAFLTCAVPDAGSILFKRFGGAWYDLDLPRHLFHFTRETLTAMLVKTGWKVVRVKSQVTLNGIAGSLGYRLRDTREGRRAVCEALLRFPESRSPLKPLAAPLGWLVSALRQTGRMVIWARAT